MSWQLRDINRAFHPTKAGCIVMLYTHLLIHSASQRHNIKDRRMNKGRRKTSLITYLPLTLLQGSKGLFKRFACERVLRTEHKLHILTPLLWPSRYVFLVLLLLGSTPSGLSEGPLGRFVVFPTTSGLWLSGILLATALAPQTQLS